MEEKEKAKQLAQRMFNVYGEIEKRTAIECSLIAVDEILNIYEKAPKSHPQNVYWKKVKAEIEKL